MSNTNVSLQTKPENYGLGLMWKMIAVTASGNSAFGATLITEILKVLFSPSLLPVCS